MSFKKGSIKGKKKQRKRAYTTDDIDISSSQLNQSRQNVSARTTDDIDDIQRLEDLDQQRAQVNSDYQTALNKDPLSAESLRLRRELDTLDGQISDLVQRDLVDEKQLNELRENNNQRLNRRRQRINSINDTPLTSDTSDGEKVLRRIKQRQPYWDKVETQLKEEHQQALDNFMSDMTSEVDKGNWVMINEKHGNSAGFAVTRMIIQGARNSGTLFLEAPYGFNGKQDKINGLREWSKQYGQGDTFNDVVDMALAYGWNVVPVDALSEKGTSNDKEALKQSGLPGSDNERQLGLQVNGVLRQNYIARNLHQGMKGQYKGGIFIVGGAHIKGSPDTGVPPISEMVSNTKYSSSDTHKLGDDTYAQVIDQASIDQLDKANYATEMEVKKETRSMQQLTDRELKNMKGQITKGSDLGSLAEKYNVALTDVQQVAQTVEQEQKAKVSIVETQLLEGKKPNNIKNDPAISFNVKEINEIRRNLKTREIKRLLDEGKERSEINQELRKIFGTITRRDIENATRIQGI